MAEMYQVNLKVVSQKGTCEAGHKVGDEFKCIGLTPGGVCLSAFDALMPTLWALMFGAEFPWSQDKDRAEVACPDAQNPVVFELRRIRPQE
jgi:uncharacterized repeat protein (TIGR04076 family)